MQHNKLVVRTAFKFTYTRLAQSRTRHQEIVWNGSGKSNGNNFFAFLEPSPVDVQKPWPGGRRPPVEHPEELLVFEDARDPYIDLPNFVDHLTRKPCASTGRCHGCKITRFEPSSRETGIKRFPAWTHRWAPEFPTLDAAAAVRDPRRGLETRRNGSVGRSDDLGDEHLQGYLRVTPKLLA